MELLKLLTLLFVTTICYAGHAEHHTHVIPVEGYETELQDLGQHVEIPETPVKVVKITKTIAVKVPVPYPVKIVEKVPYPVHVNRPYPVPVPQIVKVPVLHYPHEHEGYLPHGDQLQHSQQNGNAYQVQEHPNDAQEDAFDGPNNAEEYSAEGSPGYHNDQPQEFHGSGGDLDGHNSMETKNYAKSVMNYLNNLSPYTHYAGQGIYH